MFFNANSFYTPIHKTIFCCKRNCILIFTLFFIHNFNILQAVNNKDKFLFEDTTSVLNPSLPLPKIFLQDMIEQIDKTEYDKQDSSIYNKLQMIQPSIKTYNNYSTINNQEDKMIKNKIHELEKESYMLRSQLIEIDKNKKQWLINKDRSGYYIGIGLLFDFRHLDNKSFGINVNGINRASIFKLGYLRYFNNNAGLKAEIFGTYGNLYKLGLMQYYGIRFSVIKDKSLLTPNNNFGIFGGFGFGGYVISNTFSPNVNVHLGISYSFTKHHRVELERIFIPSFIYYIDNVKQVGYGTNYVVSYSWVF